jgi:glutamine amidotransferase-like uncharacterized protein
MKRAKIFISIVFMLLLTNSAKTQGFYKDVFMDGGMKLTSLARLPAADFLDLSIEYYASSRYKSALPPTYLDSVIQDKLLVGCPEDVNGILLYPDGAPRFRMIYVNGGKAANHGESLGELGRERIRDFVNNGGSYVGTCAGAFLASSATVRSDTVYPRNNYFKIWPGIARGTGLYNSYTGMLVVKDSPLGRYFNFDKDLYIDSLRHNGGCFAFDDIELPENTEVLMRYDYDPKIKGKSIDNKISAWAYKSNNKSGRVVLIGSHPETVTSGERLNLMAALIRYAVEGNGTPSLKGKLANGIKRNMYKSTNKNIPDSTMIGDKQYHHFTIDIEGNTKALDVILEGDNAYDIFLYLRKGDFAFKRQADYVNLSKGADKKIHIDNPEEGTWFIGIECNTTVDVIQTSWGYEYTGNTGVLNGVPYSIEANWD